MNLHFKDSGGSAEPLIILHGVFGSLSNWNAIAKKLAGRWRVLTVDLRNHGRSPHADSMTYLEMAADIADLIERLNLEPAYVMGHSMGGKVAMTLALTRPELVRKLVGLDIAPVKYPDRLSELLTSLMDLDVKSVKTRVEADQLLVGKIPASEVRTFLLQNLVKTQHGYGWRINLPVIARFMPQITGFPDFSGRQYTGGALFVRGALSDYIQDSILPEIKRVFPDSKLETVADAGHWLHHEQPDQVVNLIEEFLSAPGEQT